MLIHFLRDILTSSGGLNDAEAAGTTDAGIIQNFGNLNEVLFLEISLTENWLIFITRADGPFWASVPSWQLTGAILIVDMVATLFCLFGLFIGPWTSIVAVVRIWLFSFGVFCCLGGLYFLLQRSTGFDSLMHGKSPNKNKKQRSLEDFGKPLFAPSKNSSTNFVCSCFSTTCLDTTRKGRLSLSLDTQFIRATDVVVGWFGWLDWNTCNMDSCRFASIWRLSHFLCISKLRGVMSPGPPKTSFLSPHPSNLQRRRVPAFGNIPVKNISSLLLCTLTCV